MKNGNWLKHKATIADKIKQKGYDRLDGVILIMNRGSRASQVIDLIHLQQYRLNHIVSYKLKPRIPKMMNHIIPPPSEEIVDNNHVVTSGNELIDEMAPDKSCPAGDNNPHSPAPDSSGNPAEAFWNCGPW